MKKSHRILMAVIFVACPNLLFARNIYLNGIDISSARNQTLKNVNIRIDEHGNLFIEAPHYQVNEENTFMPLSSWVPGVNAPRHQVPQNLLDVSKVGKLRKIEGPGSDKSPTNTKQPPQTIDSKSSAVNEPASPSSAAEQASPPIESPTQ